MLTATYTLVALSVEQASMRMGLLSFQQYVQANLRNQNKLTFGQLQYACDTLNRLYQSCHWRKIERYLIPALRRATEQADRLLDELGGLNDAALAMVKAVQERAGNMTALGDEHVTQVCASIDAFCVALLQRLEKEERELFVIARSAICGETWFAIANQFLLHDARLVEQRRQRAPAMTLVAPQAQPVAAPAAPGAANEAAAPALPALKTAGGE